jgi:tetratricopeptide (TPR) repeat protein
MDIAAMKDNKCHPLFVKVLFCYLIVLMLSTASTWASEKDWQVLLTEGDVDIQQQKLGQAEDCFSRALKEIEHEAHSNDDMVKCLQRLASTLELEDKTNDALPLYRKSLHILEQTYGKDSPKVVPTLFAFGSIFEAEGDPKIAMGYYRRALHINEKHYGPFSPGVAESLHHLGHATFSAGQTDEAETHYKSSLAILMKQPSLSSSEQLESLLSDYSDLLKKNDNSNQNLISDFQKEVLKDRSRFPIPTTAIPASSWQKQMTISSDKSYAEQNNEEQKVILRGFKQPLSSSTLAPAYKTISDDLYGQHSYKQGEDYYERMIAIDIKALGPYHPSVADDLTGLALLYISQQRYAEAEPLLRRALSIYESVYGSDNLLVTRTRSSLANVLNKLGQTKQAMALYGEAFNKGHLAMDPNNLQTARMLNELAFLYYSQGKLEEARTVYQWALASTKGAAGEQNILVAACLTDYSNVLRSLGLIAEANKMSERVQEIEFAQPLVNRVSE